MTKENKNCGKFKFFAGVGLGAAIGMLFAPKAGKEIRKELKVKIDELIAKLKEVDADEVKENIEAKIFELREAMNELDEEKVLNMAKKKAAEIQDMANELVNYAVEKGTPVVEEMASGVREKAIDLTKEVLAKLEKKTTKKTTK